jgi:hypothetical protein
MFLNKEPPACFATSENNELTSLVLNILEYLVSCTSLNSAINSGLEHSSFSVDSNFYS